MSREGERPEEYPGDWSSRSMEDRFNDIIAHWDDVPAPRDLPGRTAERDLPAGSETAERDRQTGPGDREADGARAAGPADREVDGADRRPADRGGPPDGPGGNAPDPTGGTADRYTTPPPAASWEPADRIGGADDEERGNGLLPGWRSYEADDGEGHYEPPPPPPLPAGDLHFWGILVGLVGGPLLLIWQSLFNQGGSQLLTWVAILLSVGGFALLIARLPSHRDDDDTGGARL